MTRIRWFFPAFAVILAAPMATTAQVQGPLQVSIVGDTVADEGDRVSWSVFPWADRRVTMTGYYSWEFGDGTSSVSGSEETAVGHQYLDDGEFAVTASDGTGTATLRIRVRPVAPTVEVVSRSRVSEGSDRWRFEAVALDPGRQDTLTYVWDFGDGSPPREGVDLVEVEHTFPDDEPYTVTLRVKDEDGLTGEQTTTLPAPGLRGSIEGSLSLSLDADPGQADWPGAMTSVLPTGPTSTGACTYSAGFMDDEAQTAIRMIWISPEGGGVGTYSIVDPMASAPPAAGSTMLTLTHAQDAETWSMMRRQSGAVPDADPAASGDEPDDSGGGIGGLLGKLKDVAAKVGVGGSPNSQVFTAPMPDMGYVDMGLMATFISAGGTLVIERADGTAIEGRLDARLQGQWMVEGAQPFAESIRVVGTFLWPLDETARSAASGCGEESFVIASHTPEAEAEAVDYETPAVAITFSQPVDPVTVNDETVVLGYLDESEELQPVQTRIVLDDAGTVRVYPAAPLDDAVYHLVYVRGGEGGVRSLNGEPLPEDHEWRFATMPELVESGG